MSRRRTRCAIYTRKPHTEGLDQDFNSLDAQRQAGVDYVNSQKHEGWKVVRARYDDGPSTAIVFNRCHTLCQLASASFIAKNIAFSTIPRLIYFCRPLIKM